jgi:hypothetical protein
VAAGDSGGAGLGGDAAAAGAAEERSGGKIGGIINVPVHFFGAKLIPMPIRPLSGIVANLFGF